jgi:hypothetical protein
VIRDLQSDFMAALRHFPANHVWNRRIQLLSAAVSTNVPRLEMDPTSLFGHLWSQCWCYDSPETYDYYKLIPPRILSGEGSEAVIRTAPQLSQLLEGWREEKSGLGTHRPWLRFMRPPAHLLLSSDT